MRRLSFIVLAVLAMLATTAVTAVPASALQVPHDRLVRENPADFTPHLLDGEVDAIAQVGNMMVVGGTFTQAQESTGGPVLTRNYLMAFNKDTGEISTTFVPQLDNQVKALAAGPGNTVYVGGSFNKLNGADAFKITQINVATGLKVPTFKPKTTNAIVRDIRYTAGRLFMGGEFSTVQGAPRSRLAELNPTTGALLPLDIPVTGAHYGGTVQVYHMDVTPDGSKMVIIGNFTQVAGQDRAEVAMIDLTTNTLSNWQTDRYKTRCYNVFKFVVRDVEFSPDGSYFAIGTTGGYGPGSPSMCDSVARWETNATGTALNPTWIDYSGGDSTYSLAITGSAIYVGGHQRWWNNPASADNAGPGSVERTGIGALDPVNGLPLAWNPGRERGQGVFDMLATTEGLFIGSDTDRVNGELHGRLAYFPLAVNGQGQVAQPQAPDLPVNAYTLGSMPSADGSVLTRVNAGGPAIPSIDSGPDWQADNAASNPLHNTGSTTKSWGAVGSVNASVPAGTPSAVFSSERIDQLLGNEMQWNIPAPTGANIGVRLYFANQCTCTNTTGKLRFHVDVDGSRKLSNYDIVADAGNQTGTMKQFNVVSDGNLDIDFRNSSILQNPMVNAIEIINLDVPTNPGTNDAVQREFTGTTASAPATLPGSGIEWSKSRGAVLLNGNLYTAWSDGHLYKRTFDGTTFGPAEDVNLNGLTQFATEMPKMTGMFYDHGRLYYTMTGSSNLSMRYFTTGSDIVGAGLKELQPFNAGGNVAGIDWSNVRGMFLAGDQLYWANKVDGTLNRIQWSNGAVVAGTGAVVSGPGIDGVDWRTRAMFAEQTTPNQPPDAQIGSECSDLACSFTGAGSSDGDGTVDEYLWDFGDGATSTETNPDHGYAVSGTYVVTLTVTDNDGATDVATKSVAVDDQVSPISFVAATGSNTNANVLNHDVFVPGGVQAGDAMVLTLSDNAPNVAITTPAGWDQVGTQSTSGMITRVWARVATAADAGTRVRVSTTTAVRGDLTLVSYRGTDTTDPVGQVSLAGETVNRAAHTTPVVTGVPAGSWVVSHWADKTAATTGWTAPAGQSVRQQYAGTGAGHVSDVATDAGAEVTSDTAGGLTATADSASLQAIMATIVLLPAG